jgi:hypothetical protein
MVALCESVACWPTRKLPLPVSGDVSTDVWPMVMEPEDAKGAEQLAAEPPLLPLQDQVHGPLPLTDVAVPTLHKLAAGLLFTATPLAEPHWPLSRRLASQLVAEPPLLPLQVQVQGPLPLTDVAVPVVQRLVVGALVRLAPLEDPHWPLSRRLASQLAAEPPLLPLQAQVHGPLPLTDVAVPVVQRLVVGALVRLDPLEDPHWPLTAPPPPPETGVSVA